MRARRDEYTLDYLSHHVVIKQLARVAYTFHLDPVVLLRDSGDHFLTLVRLAATQVVQRDEAERDKQMRSASRKR